MYETYIYNYIGLYIVWPSSGITRGYVSLYRGDFIFDLQMILKRKYIRVFKLAEMRHYIQVSFSIISEVKNPNILVLCMFFAPILDLPIILQFKYNHFK